MGDTEEYFPRGGKKPTVTHFKQSSNFLGAPEKTQKKKKKLKKKPDTNDDGYLSDEGIKELDRSHKRVSAGISFKTVKKGLLILGRVSQVQDTKVNVMLPNRMHGVVMACHVSEPYNKLLEAYVNDETEKVRELPTMFRPGQYVALQVLETEGNHLMLSMMPQHINSGMKHSDLYKGALLQAAVSSVEDHAYAMDIGIPNTRAILPKSNANPDVELDTGMLTWCCVKSVSSSAGDSIVTLSSQLAALQAAALRRRSPAPATLLPATAIEFTVHQPLDNVIEGRVLGDTTAYIQRQHVEAVKGKKPALGQKIRGRVLYVTPTINTPFLTMKGIFDATYPDLEAEQKFHRGDVIDNAQVIKITGRTVHFKLGPGSFGLMSLHQIHVDENLSDEEVVFKSYPTGSVHKVRVLYYNMSDYSYLVTDQPDALKERYFRLEELQVGELVDATIKSVADDHLLVHVGKVPGYVPKQHMSDSGIFLEPKKATNSKLPKKKFKEGQVVKARVLTIDHDKEKLFLTLKPSLLAPDLEVLQSYEQAQVGERYTGVIKFIRDYILVCFFNNVTAYVARQHVCEESVENLTDAFHIGQIVNCTILRVNPETKKMSGSLITVDLDNNRRQKRKHRAENDEEEAVSNKILKNNSQETKGTKENRKSNEENDKKKKKKKREISVDNEESDAIDSDIKNDSQETKDTKEKRKSNEENDKKKKKKKQEISEDNEESDAIDSDIPDNDEILKPQDMLLINMSDCDTAKKYKKRVVSLLKAINARIKRVERINQKIANIEEKGLNFKNKKFHSAMHMDKLIVEERIKKLMEALSIAQEKLKEFNLEDNKEYKKKKKDKTKKKENVAAEEQETVANNKEDKVKKEKKKNDVKLKNKNIKVVDSLEPALDVPSAKEFWSASGESSSKDVHEEESSSEDEEVKEPKKKRKKLSAAEKAAMAREEEEKLRELERLAAESEASPRSSEQFERALLASPDCSQLWIAYMAFHLQATEVEKARAVGRKALATISFREEQERLNVWLAMINFENRFGTKESQQKVLEEALQMNDPFKVHSKLLDIYVETSKHQELSALVDLMMRKYKREPSTYVMCGEACFKLELVDKARQVMQKAIAVLEKKEHVPVLVQFARLERARGERERAEALLEHVLAVYPQRVDVCAVYVDALLKDGDLERVRQVMERMTSQKLPARKMKVLYKKWIEVEEKIGDREHVENIRQRALEYIDKAQF